MKIVVIGGSGQIGARLVRQLNQRGHQGIPASPTSGIDTLTGAGLAAVLEDAQVVIDVTNPTSFESGTVMHFFDTSTRNLLSAEAEAKVEHHVVLSVVGADRMADVGYMCAKVAQEQLVQRGQIPYTIVRATQFFEFIRTITDLGTKGATVRLPPALMQPIAADDVVAFLVEVTERAPSNSTIDLAGPDRIRMDEIARRLLNVNQDPREVLSDHQALYFGGRLDDRSLVPAGRHCVGMTHFQDWLRIQPPPPPYAHLSRT
ncbi:SDR family oxidoreductase [Nitrospira sp. CMX1]